MTPDSPAETDLWQDIANAIYHATGLRGETWADVSDVADEYVLADAVLAVRDTELEGLRLRVQHLNQDKQAMAAEVRLLLWLHAEAVWKRQEAHKHWRAMQDHIAQRLDARPGEPIVVAADRARVELAEARQGAIEPQELRKKLAKAIHQVAMVYSAEVLAERNKLRVNVESLRAQLARANERIEKATAAMLVGGQSAKYREREAYLILTAGWRAPEQDQARPEGDDRG